MHVHAYHRFMRTTIEIKPEHRARLLELAARRGEKGFSKLVEEALEAYFRSQSEGDPARARAEALKGALRAEEADALRETVRELRESWR
jgi:hypothetical protein